MQPRLAENLAAHSGSGEKSAASSFCVHREFAFARSHSRLSLKSNFQSTRSTRTPWTPRSLSMVLTTLYAQ